MSLRQPVVVKAPLPLQEREMRAELIQIRSCGRSVDPLQVGKARDEDDRADDHKNESGIPHGVFLSMLQRSAMRR